MQDCAAARALLVRSTAACLDGDLEPCRKDLDAALRLDPNVRDPIPYYMLMLDRVRECAEDFDILHFHIDQFQFPLFHFTEA